VVPVTGAVCARDATTARGVKVVKIAKVVRVARAVRIATLVRDATIARAVKVEKVVKIAKAATTVTVGTAGMDASPAKGATAASHARGRSCVMDRMHASHAATAKGRARAPIHHRLRSACSPSPTQVSDWSQRRV
jgi:hypothetical protein